MTIPVLTSTPTSNFYYYADNLNLPVADANGNLYLYTESSSGDPSLGDVVNVAQTTPGIEQGVSGPIIPVQYWPVIPPGVVPGVVTRKYIITGAPTATAQTNFKISLAQGIKFVAQDNGQGGGGSLLGAGGSFILDGTEQSGSYTYTINATASYVDLNTFTLHTVNMPTVVVTIVVAGSPSTSTTTPETTTATPLTSGPDTTTTTTTPTTSVIVTETTTTPPPTPTTTQPTTPPTTTTTTTVTTPEPTPTTTTSTTPPPTPTISPTPTLAPSVPGDGAGPSKFIRIGDSLNHGARVITGSTSLLTNDQKTVRIGDTVQCPIHGTNMVIAQCAETVVIDDRQVARISSIAKCGARILTGSDTNMVRDGQ